MNASSAPRYRDATAVLQASSRREHPILELLHQIVLIPAFIVIGVLAATAAAWVALLADRGEPARLGRRELGTLSREAAARVLLGSTGLLAWGSARPRPADFSSTTPPVLLVPGPPQRHNAFLYLAMFLRHRGYGWVWTAAPGRGGLAERAQALATTVAELRQASGQPQVDLVAHGLGGLAAAWYIKHLDGAANVRRLVTLGTPWRGTRMAVFTAGPLGRETLPGAPILDDLAPCPVDTVCLWGSLDPMVLPHTSARAEGSIGVEIDGAGHLDLLLSARTYRAVQAALEQPKDPA